MIRGPAVALQKAIFAAISASADVVSVFGATPPRIYDEVPANPVFPYIVIGDDEVNDDSNSDAAFECFSTVHVFARDRKTGKTAAKAIGDAVSAAIGDASGLNVAGFKACTSDSEPAFQNSRYFYEPDGLTAHGVLVFRILLDQET